VKKTRAANLVESESGQALVLTAVCMVMLMGFVGLAIDVGLLYRARQRAQIAADAAAIGATVSYLDTGNLATAIAAGKAASARNGYTDGSGGVTVTINLPPPDGWYLNDYQYTEAIVSGPQSAQFMRVLGFTSRTVTAFAVAGMTAPGDACIWLMAKNGTGLTVQGAYVITATNCGIYVNSTSTNAIAVTGNGGTMNTKFVDVVGGSVGHETHPTPITTNVTPRKNPWGDNLNGPSYPSGCSITSSATSITTSNMASVSGSSASPVVCFTAAVTLGNGVSLPGATGGVVYVFEKGVTIGTGSTVSLGSATFDSSTGTYSNTSGAVMDIAGGTLTQNSASLLNIYAPTSGTYNGIAILQPTSNTTNNSSSNPLQVQFGSNNQTLDGYIYAPGSYIFLQDHGGGIKTTGVVANQLYEKSSTMSITSYDLANPSTTPNRVMSLVA
jgi:hypothetical protein